MCLHRTWKTSCLIVRNRETDRFYSTKDNYIVDNMIVSSSWQGWGGGAFFYLWNIPDITCIVKVNQGGYIEGGETWIQTGAPVRVRSTMKWFLCFCGQHNVFLIGFPPSQCWIGGGMLHCACAQIHILSSQPVGCVFYMPSSFHYHTNFQWHKTHDFASCIISTFSQLISSLNHEKRRNND